MSLIDVRRVLGRDTARTFQEADFAVLPLGSIEWHGPHLPLGTDTLIAEDIAASLDAGEWTGVLYPPVVFTAVPGQTRHYPGTVGLRPETMVEVFSQLLAGLAGNGFRRILIVNAHDANMATVRAAMEWVSGEHPVSLLLANWFQLVTPAETTSIFGPDQPRGHGGAFETSGVLGIDEGLVALDAATDLPPRPRLTASDHVLVESHPAPWHGWSGHVSRVDTEGAQQVRRIARERLHGLVAEWLGTPAPEAPGVRP
ncbi:creatininase family protein [Agromyces silvae]|uniref:creatininase family protein n=1 Tax=Agromyces silvae TaxID=3388266 RepID=UPI00280B0049|nr:creatininase family protein [Agromyces protaetiae]